jgi:hypothetical protein
MTKCLVNTTLRTLRLKALQHNGNYTYHVKIQVFCQVTLCRWASSFRCFDGRYCLHVHGQAVLTLEDQSIRIFRKVAKYLSKKTRRRVQEEPNLQQERCSSRTPGAVCSVVVVGNEFLTTPLSKVRV